MSLANVAPTERLPAGELARDPRMMHVVAWFDGYGQAAYPGARPMDMPRRLTRSEGESWREGWREGHRERVCLSWHGVIPCPGDHPPRVSQDA